MLIFRPIQWQDAAPLYVWRHDPETVKWSLKPPPTWDEHLRWMNEVISIDKSGIDKIWMGIETIPVVTISLNQGYINIMTNPCLRKQGFATKALLWMRDPPQKLRAIVKKDNEASLRLFSKCNFKYISYNTDTLTMEWTP